MIMCYLVISVIFGEITSFASSPEPTRKPVDGTEDMAQMKISWVTHPVYKFDSGLEKKASMSDLKKKKKFMKGKEALQYVLNNPDEYVYYGVKGLVEPVIRRYFQDDKERNMFHISPQVDVPYLVSMIVRKDAPFTESITRKLLQMNAAGFRSQKFLRDAMEMFGKARKSNTGNNDTFQILMCKICFLHFLSAW